MIVIYDKAPPFHLVTRRLILEIPHSQHHGIPHTHINGDNVPQREGANFRVVLHPLQVSKFPVDAFISHIDDFVGEFLIYRTRLSFKFPVYSTFRADSMNDIAFDAGEASLIGRVWCRCFSSHERDVIATTRP